MGSTTKRSLGRGPAQRVAQVIAGDGREEDGMTTAEYAVGTVATCGLGGLFYQLVTSDWFQTALQTLFERAFTSLL
jgi:hypothetical protein